MPAFEQSVKQIDEQLSREEKRQDAVLQLQRLAIRSCAKAIKCIHADDAAGCEAMLAQTDELLGKLKEVDEGFGHISQQAYQEVVEAKVLLAIYNRKEIPSFEELGVQFRPWLSGLADCVGELRRALQISLANDKRSDAEYYFSQMSRIYDNLMVLKYSGSLVGPLKPKQDMVRSQVEHARSEMLRSR